MSDGSGSRRNARVSFGPFRLNVVERILERDGQPVRLGGRALDILIALLERPGEVVGQRELVDRVWPNIYVNDGALRVQVWGLRQALGDGTDGTRYIANVPGRGYSFVGVVEAEPGVVPAEIAARLVPPPVQLLTNLRRRLGPLIGRETEVAELSARVAQRPLVTIVGSGGIGKSSLANEVGWRSAVGFPQGVWLIDLAPLADGIVVLSAVAAVLGVSVQGGAVTAEAIAAAIGRRRMLLIFDNCERLTAPVAELIDKLLQKAPALSVLAASQEALRLDREQIYRLGPLAAPPAGAHDISGYPAVTLFVERAREADRRFELDAGNAAVVAEICRRLDGIPLALEMAAARLLLLGVEGLRAGLDKRLRVLKTDRRTETGRYQTLRSMVEWSYSLLDAEAGTFFRRLAIFPGSFTLDAAIAVGGEGNADHWDVVDCLGTLVSKSVVVAEASEPPRFRLLETLRLFGLERLMAERESVVIAERHARYVKDLFDRAYVLRETMPQDEWSRAYVPEIDNVRAALDWALATPGYLDIAIALTAGAGALWETLGISAEGRRYIEKVSSLIDPEAVDHDVARFWGQSGYFLRKHDSVKSLDYLERSCVTFRKLGDRLNLARFESSRGWAIGKRNRIEEAKSILSEAEKVLRGSSFQRSELELLVNFGVLAYKFKDIAGARQYFTEALEKAEARGFSSLVMVCRNNIANLEFTEGNADLAARMLGAAVDQLRISPDREIFDFYLTNLIRYLVQAGRPKEARKIAEETLSGLRFMSGERLLHCVGCWALLFIAEGHYREAASMLGFYKQGFPRIGLPYPIDSYHPSTREDRFIDLLKAALPADEYEACTSEGAGWAEEQAIDFVINCAAPSSKRRIDQG